MLRSSKKFLIPLAFGAGLSIGSLINTNGDFSFNKPLMAATAQNLPSQDIVPYRPGAVLGSKTGDEFAMVSVSRTTEIMRHGYPTLDNLRVFDNYVLSYDRRNRVANWVFEHLTHEKLKRVEDVDRGKSEFKEDPLIHEYFRSTNQDYKASGYDRGHMAAAANHRSNQKLMDQTFYLSNIAPQVGKGFNRDKWNELELEVRNLVKQYDNVWICTGPLYLPRKETDNKMYVKYEVIGAHNVAVPTHFFKVILCEKQGNYSLFSYVLPNMPCDEKIPLSSYLVSLDSIERAAGFLLFDKLPRNKFKAINGK